MHLCGFDGQRDLLAFAGSMEDSADFDEVSLTRVSNEEAWLTVRAETSSEVVAALRRIPGFELDVTVDQNLVEARARYVTSNGMDPEPQTSPSVRSQERDTLLPPRPRFRAFRPPPLGTSGEQAAHDADDQRTSDRQPPSAPQPLPSSARPPAPVREEPATRPAASTPQPDAPAERPRPSSLAPSAPGPSMPPPPRVAATRTEDRTSPRPATPAPTPAPASPIFTSSAPASAGAPPTAPDAAPPAAPAPMAPAAPRSRDLPLPPDDRPAPPPQATPAPTTPPPASEDDFVEPEDRPGGAVMTVEHLTLVVYPFRSFAILNEFQAAIRGLRGVKSTRVRRFYRGTLHLAVDYEDMIPLSDRLGDLKEIEFQVASESRSELEIVLQDSSPLAAAGGN